MIIAAWSGPRNLSTAMMYAFGARSDCAVQDEPFYAAFLARSGEGHPMRDDILRHQSTNPQEVARCCAAAPPKGAQIVYQKHMAHHMIDGMPRDWFAHARHMILLRHPARVLASYARKRHAPTLDDIGARQLTEIFETVAGQGTPPVVVDSDDIRADPAGMLAKLCVALDLRFDPAMLSWPAGGHKDDGVWARHWYDAVHRSTGFAGPSGPLPPVDEALRDVHDAALPHYEALRVHAIKPASRPLNG
ncbi:MAG: HAD family hydrolase [Primorskyibacter sp.]